MDPVVLIHANGSGCFFDIWNYVPRCRSIEGKSKIETSRLPSIYYDDNSELGSPERKLVFNEMKVSQFNESKRALATCPSY
jgi:hypothetical protein